nr:unnamed protein product [Callosobruchus chinensis]
MFKVLKLKPKKRQTLSAETQTEETVNSLVEEDEDFLSSVIFADCSELFFNTLNDVLDTIKDKEDVMLIGDFNGHVGKEDEDIVGRFGEDEDKNDNGNRILEICRERELIIANTKFQHKGTYIDTLGRNQAECASNHRLVLGKFIYTGKYRKDNTQKDEELEKLDNTRYKVELLQQFSIRPLYENRLQNILEDIEEWTPTEMYQHLKRAVTNAAKEALGIEENKNKYLEKYSDDLEEMIKKKKDASLKWLSQKTPRTPNQ